MPNLPFKATKRMRDEVMCLVASGMGQRSIAHALGIARSTLEIHFAHELEVGMAKKQARLNKLLWSAADNGHVAAMKYLHGQTHGLNIPLHQRAIGKKELQFEEAKTAGVGTEWEADLMRIERPHVNGDDKPN